MLIRERPERAPDPGAADGGGVEDLRAWTAQSYDDIRQRLAAVKGASRSDDDPRHPRALLDAAVAAVCAHVGVVEVVLLPVVTREVAGGREQARSCERSGRELVRTARRIQQVAWGDSRAVGWDLHGLVDELCAQVARHGEAEQHLVARLDDALDAERSRALVDMLRAEVQRAPTRPHPHAPHRTRLAARLAWRFDRMWDAMLDVMDNRLVPGAPRRRAAPPPTLWGSYLLGQPFAQGGDTPSEARPEPAPQR